MKKMLLGLLLFVLLSGCVGTGFLGLPSNQPVVISGVEDHNALNLLNWSEADHNIDSDIDMQGNTLINLPEPVDTNDAVNMGFVEKSISDTNDLFVNESGDVMNGDLSMNSDVYLNPSTSNSTTNSNKLILVSRDSGTEYPNAWWFNALVDGYEFTGLQGSDGSYGLYSYDRGLSGKSESGSFQQDFFIGRPSWDNPKADADGKLFMRSWSAARLGAVSHDVRFNFDGAERLQIGFGDYGGSFTDSIEISGAGGLKDVYNGSDFATEKFVQDNIQKYTIRPRDFVLRSPGPALNKTDGSAISYYSLDFDPDTAEKAVAHVTMPENYNAGNSGEHKLYLYWTAGGFTDNQVKWKVEAVRGRTGQVFDSSVIYSTRTTDSISAGGYLVRTTLYLNTNLYADNVLTSLIISRDATDVGDTLDSDAKLVNASVVWDLE